MTRTDFFSADDFGGCLPSSKRIAGYVRKGWIQSVSIFGNCRNADEYLRLLPEDSRVGIHLDLTEGFPLSDKKDIPLLINSSGRFHDSFFRLLLLSVIRPKKISGQIYTEISAQLQNILSSLPEDYEIRVDSHRHFHMIPAVFNALCLALKDTGRKVSYIRFPSEQAQVYLSTPAAWPFIQGVNLIKVLVLNLCGVFNLRLLKKYGFENCREYFCGVMFSGHMTLKELTPVYKKLLKKARRHGKKIEFLFHPGWLSDTDRFPDEGNPFIDFYLSRNRRREAASLPGLTKKAHSSNL